MIRNNVNRTTSRRRNVGPNHAHSRNVTMNSNSKQKMIGEVSTETIQQLTALNLALKQFSDKLQTDDLVSPSADINQIVSLITKSVNNIIKNEIILTESRSVTLLRDTLMQVLVTDASMALKIHELNSKMQMLEQYVQSMPRKPIGNGMRSGMGRNMSMSKSTERYNRPMRDRRSRGNNVESNLMRSILAGSGRNGNGSSRGANNRTLTSTQTSTSTPRQGSNKSPTKS